MEQRRPTKRDIIDAIIAEATKGLFTGDKRGGAPPPITISSSRWAWRLDIHSGPEPAHIERPATNRDIVQHGFRSCFKDWASECTSYRDAISDAVLAHISADR
jgi:hypothetical protein